MKHPEEHRFGPHGEGLRGQDQGRTPLLLSQLFPELRGHSLGSVKYPVLPKITL